MPQRVRVGISRVSFPVPCVSREMQMTPGTGAAAEGEFEKIRCARLRARYSDEEWAFRGGIKMRTPGDGVFDVLMLFPTFFLHFSSSCSREDRHRLKGAPGLGH